MGAPIPVNGALVAQHSRASEKRTSGGQGAGHARRKCPACHRRNYRRSQTEDPKITVPMQRMLHAAENMNTARGSPWSIINP